VNRLTEEQAFAVEMAQKCTGNMRIEAFAGTGKTTTLAAIAKAMPKKKGQFLAFNRAIAEDSKSKLPKSCRSNSFHQLAYAKFGRSFGPRLNQRISGWTVAQGLGISNGVLPASDMGSLALGTVSSFCRTLDHAIGPQHVPAYMLGPGKKQTGVFTDAVRWANRLWTRMSSESDEFPTSHDVYLRLYAESNPRIAADYILFDEAQDADALMLHVLLQQDCPVIFVGDRWQQIYAWRGAVNAMSKIRTDDVAKLTTSFRFGEAIADRASAVLRTMGESVSIRGFSGRDSRLMKIAKYPHAVIARTNAEATAVIFEHERKRVATTGLNEAVDFFKAYVALRDKKKVPLAYRFFKSLTELKHYANESDEGADLKPYFKLLSKRTPETIMERLASVAPYSPDVEADMVVSTAHKCKGLEFPRVQLRGDFLPLGRDRDSGKTKPPAEEEVRLLYVALTRASEVLDDSAVPWERLRLEFPALEAEAAPPQEVAAGDNEGSMDEAFFNMLYDVWQENPPESAWRTIDLFFLAKSGEAFTPASLAKRWGISETKAEVILFGLKGMLAQRGLLRS
jgi:hypothetical protein